MNKCDFIRRENGMEQLWKLDRRAERFFLHSLGERTTVNQAIIYQHYAEGIKVRNQYHELLVPVSNSIQLNSGDFSLHGDCLTLKGENIDCQAFHSFQDSKVNAMIIYLNGVNDITNENMLESYYLHLWKNAYLLSTLIELKEKYRGKQRYDSCIFGPGYYGIENHVTSVLYELLQPKKVFFHLVNNQIVPKSSNIGFFFLSTEPIVSEVSPCSFCYGKAKNCELCAVRWLQK